MCKSNNESNATEWAEKLEEEQLSRSQEVAMTMEEFSLSSRALLRRMKQKVSENMPEWTTSSAGSDEEEDEQEEIGYLGDDNRDDDTVDIHQIGEQKKGNAKTSRKKKRGAKEKNDSSYSSTMMKKAKEAIVAVTEQQETELRDKQEKIIWRDFTFLSIALVLGCIMSFVEMHSADVEIRGGTVDDVAKGG
ncbi:MAG: hypothetical protein SGARI_007486, partial [Bacillariaceae sp.]